MYKFKKVVLKPTKKIINKQKADGKVVNIFGEVKTEIEAKTLFGSRYNDLLVKYIYQLFEKDVNGNDIFITKNNADQMVISKNPKSFRLINLTKTVKAEPNTKILNPEYTYKTIDNKINMLVRNDDDYIKKTSPNALYDVLNISINLEGELSDQLIRRHRNVNINEIQDIKHFLNIPQQDKLKPRHIGQIVKCVIYSGYISRSGKEIDAYGDFFPIGTGIKLSVHITTRGQGCQSLKLMKDGANYYLFNNVRNYDDMNNFFTYVDINIEDEKNCVIETLKYIYTNYILKSRKTIKLFRIEFEKLEKVYNESKISISYNKLVEFMESIKLNYKIFNFTNRKDYNANTFYPKEKIFNFIVYNKHLYLIENEKDFNKIKYSLDTNDKYFILSSYKFTNTLNKLLKNKKKPSLIKIDKEFNSFNAEIFSFEDEKKVYIKDDENNTHENLLYLCQALNITYNPYLTESNFINEVIKQRNIKETKSFYLYQHTSKEILYSEEIEDPENFITIDFNKFYTSILMSFNKIPIINNIIHNAEPYIMNEKIDNNYLYSIEIMDSNYNIWFRNDDLYFGCILNTEYYKHVLNEMLNNKQIKIIDKIKIEWIDNYYKPILSELFNVVDKTKNKNEMSKTIKNIINRTIGKFNNGIPELKEIKKNIHIEEKNDIIEYHNDNETYYSYNIGDLKYKVFYTNEYIKNKSFNVLENHKPLRTLILNHSMLCMLKFKIDKKIDDCDIYQLNTDSMTFRNSKYNPEQEENEIENYYLAQEKKKKNKKIKYNDEDEIYYSGKYNQIIEDIENDNSEDIYNLCGIKIQDYKKISNVQIGKNNISFINDITKHSNKFNIVLGYAGSGKSYKITKQIKQFEEQKETYILLAPLLKVLRMYSKDINKNTVQHFTRNLLIPQEKNIIIDEFYLINFKDFRYIINWLYNHEKNIYLFGDKNQLPPITPNNSTYSLLNFDFIKTISTSYLVYDSNDKNHRNNFDFEVYKEFISNNYTIEEQKNIINHFINNRCDTTKKYINICYRNEIKDKINNENLIKNNQVFSKDIISGKDIPLIAKKNIKISDDIIICSKDEYNLTVESKKHIISYEDLNGKLITFEMASDKIYKYFDVAYCLNLYNIQGQTLTNFKYILDDVYFLNKDNCYNIIGGFYTLISRIKEDLTDKKISVDDINKIKNNNKTITFKSKKIKQNFYDLNSNSDLDLDSDLNLNLDLELI